ncbi:hypothetical protein FRB95_004871 [Tulasnella sp. JGI-2019a]|nr:hypothetical protein FRB95_004871 [Tulasnella sp. JGI-2019a]
MPGTSYGHARWVLGFQGLARQLPAYGYQWPDYVQSDMGQQKTNKIASGTSMQWTEDHSGPPGPKGLNLMVRTTKAEPHFRFVVALYTVFYVCPPTDLRPRKEGDISTPPWIYQ